MNEVYVVN